MKGRQVAENQPSAPIVMLNAVPSSSAYDVKLSKAFCLLVTTYWTSNQNIWSGCESVLINCKEIKLKAENPHGQLNNNNIMSILLRCVVNRLAEAHNEFLMGGGGGANTKSVYNLCLTLNTLS
jgi:hypothetical protein